MSETTQKLSAYQELLDELRPDETVEAIVFGAWGTCLPPEGDEAWELEDVFGEPGPSPPVPLDKRGVLLTLDEARPFMEGWSFLYGYNQAYATTIWTNHRILFVVEYDGTTWLDSVPLVPAAGLPKMYGR